MSRHSAAPKLAPASVIVKGCTIVIGVCTVVAFVSGDRWWVGLLGVISVVSALLMMADHQLAMRKFRRQAAEYLVILDRKSRAAGASNEDMARARRNLR